MKAKLIKVDDIFYIIKDLNGELIEGNLSLKNCQSIERGYDLDELAKNEYRNFPSRANGEKILTRWGEDQHATKKQKAYKKGFMKALELMGDKKFSEVDMLNFGEYVWKHGGRERSMNQLLNDCKAPQQTEWDVEIVMEEAGIQLSPNVTSVEDSDYVVTTQKPKLDEDGCIILKKFR